jgi:hypothetical protein
MIESFFCPAARKTHRYTPSTILGLELELMVSVIADAIMGLESSAAGWIDLSKSRRVYAKSSKLPIMKRSGEQDNFGWPAEASRISQNAEHGQARCMCAIWQLNSRGQVVYPLPTKYRSDCSDARFPPAPHQLTAKLDYFPD